MVAAEWQDTFIWFAKKDREGNTLRGPIVMARRLPNGEVEYRAMTKAEDEDYASFDAR